MTPLTNKKDPCSKLVDHSHSYGHEFPWSVLKMSIQFHINIVKGSHRYCKRPLVIRVSPLSKPLIKSSVIFAMDDKSNIIIKILKLKILLKSSIDS